MASVAALERRRRETAAAYVKAVRGHAPRAAIARKLVAATCAALKAEIRAARRSQEPQAGQPDLFGEPA